MAEQVGKFLTELPELETPTDGDLMYIVDDETTSKKVTMANLKRVLGGNVTGTVEDASVSFSDGADGIPMEECEVTLVPSQDLHGYSKPWAGGAGKNKLNVTATSTTESGVTITINSDGTIETTNTATATILLSLGSISTEGTYKIYGCPSGGSSTTYELRASNTNGNFVQDFGSGSTNITVGSGETLTAYLIIRSGVNATGLTFKPMILLSTETATTFEPYSNICPISGHTDVTITVASTSGGSGEDYTVSLGSTYYGGKLDVTKGELTIDRASVTLSDLSWNYADVNNGVYRFSSGAITNFKVMTARTMNLVCSTFEENVGGQPWDDGTIYNNGGTSLVIATSLASDTTQLATLISGQTCVYELATPQTFTLTKEQIQTLLGQNYVSHDGGGNIKVVYIRDLDITINDLIDRVTALENE